MEEIIENGRRWEERGGEAKVPVVKNVRTKRDLSRKKEERERGDKKKVLATETQSEILVVFFCSCFLSLCLSEDGWCSVLGKEKEERDQETLIRREEEEKVFFLPVLQERNCKEGTQKKKKK